MSPGAPVLFSALLQADQRSRSLEAACDRLVALPAGLAASPASPLSVEALHSAVASVASVENPGNPYLAEAELQAGDDERLHYLGRALEAAGVASALRSIQASHTPSGPAVPGSPPPSSSLRALIADPASPARAVVLAEMRAALAQFGDAFAARAAEEAEATATTATTTAAAKTPPPSSSTLERPSPPSSGAPTTPTPAARRSSAQEADQQEGEADGTADNDDDSLTRATAVEAVRARLHALSSPTGGPRPASQTGRVKLRLPERPPPVA